MYTVTSVSFELTVINEGQITEVTELELAIVLLVPEGE